MNKNTCAICGQKTDDGVYFGKVKLPVEGTGEYKVIRKSKIFEKIGDDTEYDIVEWTGEEKEFDYYECDKCYNEID